MTNTNAKFCEKTVGNVLDCVDNSDRGRDMLVLQVVDRDNLAIYLIKTIILKLNIQLKRLQLLVA